MNRAKIEALPVILVAGIFVDIFHRSYDTISLLSNLGGTMKVMIVGAGKLGVKLAEAMTVENMDVTLVDSDAKVIENINEHLDVLTVVASGISITMLKEMNIEEYDIIVACTENDETNAVICTFAKKLGCNQTVARIRNPEYTEQLTFVRHELGIDLIMNPDLATATSISNLRSRTM